MRALLPETSLIRDFPLRWLVFWLLVPNLAIILMWFVGGPPMTPALTIFGGTALIAAQAPWVWPKRAVLVGLIAYVSYYYVLVLFNLDTGKVDFLLPFIMEVKPFRSPEYIVAAIVLLASVVLALKKAPHVPRFSSPMSYCLALLSIMGVLAADYMATQSTRSTYRRAAPVDAPFVSATNLAGLEQPGEEGRHLVIILVEALGVPLGTEEQAIYAADWDRPQWRGRYDVSHGQIPFYGSTTSGELRELCGMRSSYTDIDRPLPDCLPARYQAAGYETRSLHGFSPVLFDRDRWYPLIGFDVSTFRDDLSGRGVSHCNGVFAGSCDREIPALIAQQIKAAEAPQLIYFLTLNTHLPIMSDASLRTTECTLGGAAWANENPQLCRLFLLHSQLADEIDRMAMDPDMPPTDILIAGDHFPPFFDRTDRSRFAADVVPWVFLQHRASQAMTAAAEENDGGKKS